MHAMAGKLGFPALPGLRARSRTLAYTLIISQVLRSASKLSTAAWLDDLTLGAYVGVAGASTDDIYAMDSLADGHDDIEDSPARGPETFPQAVDAIRGTFGLHQMIMAEGQVHEHSARFKDLRELDGVAQITYSAVQPSRS